MRINELSRRVAPWHEVDVPTTRWPSFQFAGAFGDRLLSMRPKGVELIVAMSPGRVPGRKNTFRMVTIAHYRVAYSVIERLARLLAPTVLSTGVIPIIEVVKAGLVEKLEPDDRFVTDLARHGARLYKADDR